MDVIELFCVDHAYRPFLNIIKHFIAYCNIYLCFLTSRLFMHALMSLACYQLEGNKILLCTKIISLSDEVFHSWDERNHIYTMMDYPS